MVEVIQSKGNAVVSNNPIETVIDLQGWLERVCAIIDLAARDIDDRSSGCTVLGVAEDILRRSIDHLEAVEVALKRVALGGAHA